MEQDVVFALLRSVHKLRVYLVSRRSAAVPGFVHPWQGHIHDLQKASSKPRAELAWLKTCSYHLEPLINGCLHDEALHVQQQACTAQIRIQSAAATRDHGHKTHSCILSKSRLLPMYTMIGPEYTRSWYRLTCDAGRAEAMQLLQRPAAFVSAGARVEGQGTAPARPATSLQKRARRIR